MKQRTRKEIEEEMEEIEMEMKSNRHILIPLLHTTVQTELLLDIRYLLQSNQTTPKCGDCVEPAANAHLCIK